ncbi:hypothetical protein LZP69_16155, partial [Shewanella sp. AS1]|uniref:hypothetical protein n=1 Tax=Shewanella sp. AS1 TaxID=2907626 RepID=UPI001F2C5E83
FTLDLPARGEAKWKGADVTTMYDRSGAKFGEAYDGYVIVFKDAEGRVVAVKSSIAAFSKDVAKLETLKADGYYDSHLEPLKVDDTYSRRLP